MPTWVPIGTLVETIASTTLNTADQLNANPDLDNERVTEAKRRIRDFLSKRSNTELTRGLRIPADGSSGVTEAISFDFWMEPHLNWIDKNAWLQERKEDPDNKSPHYIMRATNNLVGYGDIEISSDVEKHIPLIPRGWRSTTSAKVRDNQPALNVYAAELLRAQGPQAVTQQAYIAELMKNAPDEWKRRFGTSCPSESTISVRLSEAARLEGGWQSLVRTALSKL